VSKRTRIVIPDKPADGHLGYYRKGDLPHLDFPRLMQHITFHLLDSVPKHLRRDASGREIDVALDGGHGECLLADSTHAQIVIESLRAHEGVAYTLDTWVVMPNHVHVLATLCDGSTLGAVVKGWKARSSRLINRAIGRCGPLWKAGYFDRYTRDADHLQAVRAYIEANPIQAGLCRRKGQWPFSSAWDAWSPEPGAGR